MRNQALFTPRRVIVILAVAACLTLLLVAAYLNFGSTPDPPTRWTGASRRNSRAGNHPARGLEREGRGGFTSKNQRDWPLPGGHGLEAVMPNHDHHEPPKGPLADGVESEDYTQHLSKKELVVSMSVSLKAAWTEFLSSGSETLVQLKKEGKPRTRCNQNHICSLDNRCLSTEDGVCYDAPAGLFIEKDDPLIQPWSSKKGSGDSDGRRRAKGGTDSTELECSWAPTKADTLPHLVVPSGLSQPEQVVHAFKTITGADFQRWYDWKAPIKRVNDLPKRREYRDTEPKGYGPTAGPAGVVDHTPADPARRAEDGVDPRDVPEDAPETKPPKPYRFQFTSGHDLDGSSKLYRMKHVCVRPSGALAGYKPIIGAWNGGTDVTTVMQQHNAKQESYQHDWVQNIEALEDEPEWYVDQRLVIVPMFGEWSVHPGHAMQRAGNVVWNVDEAFPRQGVDALHPDWAREDVTTMFTHVWMPAHTYTASVRHPNRPTCDEKKGDCMFSDYGYQAYTTLATKGHFMTRTQDGAAYKTFYQKTQAGKRPGVTAGKMVEVEKYFVDSPLCFKEAVVWQACYWPDCNKTKPEGGGHQWPLYGWRQPATQQKIAKRFRACVGVEHLARTTINAEKPLVLHSYRTFGKHLHRSEVVAARVLSLVEKHGGTLKVVKLKNNVMHMVTLYSQVDMIVSPYGSGLLYGFVTPPGSVGVEISHASVHPGASVGINRLSEIDYTSQYKAHGGYLMAASLQTSEARYHTAVSVPLAVIDYMVGRGYCGLKEHNPDRYPDQVLEKCQFDESALAPAVRKHRKDADGVQLKQNMKRVTPNFLSSASKSLENTQSWVYHSASFLVAFNHFAQSLTPAFANMRQTATKLLLLYDLTPPAGATTPDYKGMQARIQVELDFYRSYFSENIRIYIFFSNAKCNIVRVGWGKFPCRSSMLDLSFVESVNRALEGFHSPNGVRITKEWVKGVPHREGMPPRYTGEIHNCGMGRVIHLAGGVPLPPAPVTNSTGEDENQDFLKPDVENDIFRLEAGDQRVLESVMSDMDIGAVCGHLTDANKFPKFDLAIADAALLRSSSALMQLKKMMRTDLMSFIIALQKGSPVPGSVGTGGGLFSTNGGAGGEDQANSADHPEIRVDVVARL